MRRSKLLEINGEQSWCRRRNWEVRRPGRSVSRHSEMPPICGVKPVVEGRKEGRETMGRESVAAIFVRVEHSEYAWTKDQGWGQIVCAERRSASSVVLPKMEAQGAGGTGADAGLDV